MWDKKVIRKWIKMWDFNNIITQFIHLHKLFSLAQHLKNQAHLFYLFSYYIWLFTFISFKAIALINIIRIILWLLDWLLTYISVEMQKIRGLKPKHNPGKKRKASLDLSTNPHTEKCWKRVENMTDLEKRLE